MKSDYKNKLNHYSENKGKRGKDGKIKRNHRADNSKRR